MNKMEKNENLSTLFDAIFKKKKNYEDNNKQDVFTASKFMMNHDINNSGSFSRKDFIQFLSNNLYETIILKLQISDIRLRKHHLSAKGLGDDLYFLTESYYRRKGMNHNKYRMTDFITPKAYESLKSNKKTRYVFEHMVPKNIYLNWIVEHANSGELTYDYMFDILNKYYYTCTVTYEENKLLPSTNMQEGWDKQNPFYRYQMVGIEFFENPK